MASEYLKWKYRDVKPREKIELTKKQRRQNWWYYNKWFVVLGLVLIGIAVSWIWRVATKVHPDYQIAYVGSWSLSEEEAAQWQDRLSALGTDSNGDGKVVVLMNQYPNSSGSGDAMYGYAYNIKLVADFDSCESYFFLLEDPEAFQESYEILEEDWFPVSDTLYLARRIFESNKTVKNLEDCELLWDALVKEAGR